MAKQKLTELQRANSVNSSDLVYVVQSNTSKSVNTGSFISSFSTANVKEHAANLYFTNTRARQAISVAGSASYNELTGIITITNVAQEYVANINGANGQVVLTTFNIAEVGNLYYTNARVYSNVIGLLNLKANVADLNTNNVSEGVNLYYTNARVYANIAPLLTTANIAELDNLYYTNARVYANIAPLLTTSNVSEVNNLYYTNARVYSNVIGLLDLKANVADLNTNNVSEGVNLYYTNARVYANISPLLTTANVTEIDNLYYTNARVYSNIAPLLTTANVSEVNNLYYTNARVYSNVIGLLNLKSNVVDLTTANVAELNNLYFTNVRVREAVSAGDQTLLYDQTLGTFRANLDLLSLGNINISAIAVTDDINEGSSNLYYTNTRVSANVTQYLLHLQSNIIPDSSYNIHIGSETNKVSNIYVKNLIVDASTITLGNLRIQDSGGVFTVLAPGGSIAPTITDSGNVTETTKLFYSNARVYANIAPLLTTANVTEIENLYYTNARVYANIAPLLTTANITELDNLYYTNSRVLANITPLLNLKANVADLNTSNIIEGSNLYYTNVRAILAVIPAVTQLVVTTPIFNYNIDQYGGDNPTIYVTAGETICFDLNIGAAHPLNIRVSNGGSSYNTGLTHVSTDGTITTGSSAQGKVTGKLFWKVPFELAGNTYVYQCSNHASMVGSIVIQPSTILSTSFLAEGSNLYYTNARVYANIAPLLTTANVSEVNNLYYTNARVYANIAPLLTTANIVELDNLYYTNARVYSNVIGLINLKANVADLNTSNVIEGTNLYYTNARVLANVTPLLDLKANVADLNTSNIAEGTRLYYTNARVIANVLYSLQNNVFSNLHIAGNISITGKYVGDGSGLYGVAPNLITYGGNILAGNISSTGHVVVSGNVTAGNVITTGKFIGDGSLLTGISTPVTVYADIAKKANIVDLTTANVSELNNLYYTNARVYANVIGLLDLKANITQVNLKANVADLNTSNIAEGNNLYYTNSRTRSAFTAGDNLLLHANGRIDANLSLATNAVINVASVQVTGNVRANSFVSSGTGIPTLQSSTNINLSANSAVVITRSVLRLASFTQSEINGLTALAGDVVYNTSNNKFQGYTTSGWVDLH
jgi:hypothetical protein